MEEENEKYIIEEKVIIVYSIIFVILFYPMIINLISLINGSGGLISVFILSAPFILPLGIVGTIKNEKLIVTNEYIEYQSVKYNYSDYNITSTAHEYPLKDRPIFSGKRYENLNILEKEDSNLVLTKELNMTKTSKRKLKNVLKLF